MVGVEAVIGVRAAVRLRLAVQGHRGALAPVAEVGDLVDAAGRGRAGAGAAIHRPEAWWRELHGLLRRERREHGIADGMRLARCRRWMSVIARGEGEAAPFAVGRWEGQWRVRV